VIFEFSPLLLALAVSIVGTTLQVWHRHGGPTWMFTVGGFLFILGRLMIAALCALVVLYFLSRVHEMDRDSLLIVGLPTILIFGIGAWSAFVIVRSVYRDAFGRSQQEATAPKDRKHPG
jgi:hypothetical protein